MATYGSVTKQVERKLVPTAGDHVKETKKISSTAAYIQLVKGNLGPGCLALPYAFSHGGLVESTVVFAVVVAIVLYGMLSLLDCKRSLLSRNRNGSQTELQTYGDVAQELLGSTGKIISDILLVVLQFGILAVQVDFVSTTLQVFLPNISQRVLSAMCLPVFMALSTILSLKKLTPFVSVALVAMISAIIVVVVLALGRISANGVDIGAMPSWEPANIPVLFGAILYAFEGITIVLPIETQMAKPQQCRSVLLSAMLTVAAIFFCVAMLSYLAFGVVQSGSITAELESRGGGDVVFFINVALILATVLSYPLQLIPAAEVLEDYLDARPKNYQLVSQDDGTLETQRDSSNIRERRLFRIGITIICGALAIVFSNNLGLAMAVVGSLAGAGLGLVVPMVMNLIRCFSGDFFLPYT